MCPTSPRAFNTARRAAISFEAAGVVRNLRIDGDAATGGVTGSDSEVAWGLMGAAAIKLADIATLSAVATYGDGVGRYIINGGFASAVAAGTAANPDLETIEAWGVAAALGLGVTETVTMNFVLGYFDQTRSDIIAGQIDDLTTVHAQHVVAAGGPLPDGCRRHVGATTTSQAPGRKMRCASSSAQNSTSRAWGRSRIRRCGRQKWNVVTLSYRRRRSFLVLPVVAVVMALAVSAAAAQTLDRVAESGTFKIGYREDARPFLVQGTGRTRRTALPSSCAARSQPT